MSVFRDKIQTIKGIGPKKAALFSKLGIDTIGDALKFFPRDYEYREAIKKIDSIKEEGMVSLCLEWKGTPKVKRMRRGFSITTLEGHDETGWVECIWFNQPYRAAGLKKGKKYFVYGKAVRKSFGYQLQNPVTEEYEERVHNHSSCLPVYPLTRGLTQRDVRYLTKNALEKLTAVESGFLDSYISARHDFPDRKRSFQQIHFPENDKELERARKRLAFEEFLLLQAAVQYTKSLLQKKSTGLIITVSRELLDGFIKKLPFSLTPAQTRVLDEVVSDLAGGGVMNRLIQGDVGSGKTVIAAAALYCVAKSGFQCAMMAPTEILAEQHLAALSNIMDFPGKDINLALLTGSMKESEKNTVKQKLKEGRIQILLGTHALIQDDVEFSNLGLVITDEQHRFGVRQRALLQSKGNIPHMLIMSATPIPRTLAHILHGDLDLSVIDTLPPGRIPVRTYHVDSSYRDRIYRFVKKHALQGNQTYVICPQIEESESSELRSAEQVYKELSNGCLKGIGTGLLHGRQDFAEKKAVMEEFLKGTIQVLISTTVVEVGIHVPNAVIMVVENAERFGLAQLHQLRGRVGRGSRQSYCILVSDVRDETGLGRLNALVNSNDGFEIAEKDLELRGPGELYGLRQHGLPQFSAANPLKDYDLFILAKQAAEEIINTLHKEEHQAIVKEALASQDRLPAVLVVN
jgi:ATP-dependent DNA helicase RecG